MKLINYIITIWAMMFLITIIYNAQDLASNHLVETYNGSQITSNLFDFGVRDPCGKGDYIVKSLNDLDSDSQEYINDMNTVTQGGDSNLNIFDPFQKLINYGKLTKAVGFFTGLSTTFTTVNVISCSTSLDDDNNPLQYLVGYLGTLYFLILIVLTIKWLIGRITNTD